MLSTHFLVSLVDAEYWTLQSRSASGLFYHIKNNCVKKRRSVLSVGLKDKIEGLDIYRKNQFPLWTWRHVGLDSSSVISQFAPWVFGMSFNGISSLETNTMHSQSQVCFTIVGYELLFNFFGSPINILWRIFDRHFLPWYIYDVSHLLLAWTEKYCLKEQKTQPWTHKLDFCRAAHPKITLS